MLTVDIQLPAPYPKQREAIWSPARTAIIEASTKAGKTVGCIVWLLDQAYSNASPNAAYWWVAPVYPQARIAYRRTVDMLRRSGMPTTLWKANDTEMTLELSGYGTIWFKTGEKPDNLYGEDVMAAVIDEGSRVREEAWHAVRSTVTHTGGPIRIIGNVKGRKNWAYQLGVKARAGEPGLSYALLTAKDAVDAGIMDQAGLDDARRVLPEQVFRELFFCEPSDDGGNPFGLNAIAACVCPVSTAPPVAFGVDLAKSQDWTVVIGLDAAGLVCRMDRWQGPWNLTEPRILAMIGDVPALVDATGVGDPIVERLQRSAYAVEGFKFSSTSKQMLMEGLAAAIHQGRVGFPDGVMKEELEQFEYETTRTGVRYSAPDGLHDDCVCALALAVEKSKSAGGFGLQWVSDKPEPTTARITFADLRKNPDWGFE